MLFFFVTTTNKICPSLNRVVRFLLFVLFICCILPSITNAYPFPSSSSSLSNINHIKNRHWLISNDKISNDNYLDRVQRGTGYYIVRQGDYFVLIPDSKHHFTKNMRPYIGRRR
jgi:hypothetical protein